MRSLNIFKKLNVVGEANLIGSMALDLMVYRDIDIEVLVPKLDKKLISGIIRKIALEFQRRIDFSLMDNTVDTKEKFPKGIYLGIKYHPGLDWVSDFSNNEETWKIDIWFVDSQNARSLKTTEEIKSKLNAKYKRIILEIKSHLYKSPGYRKDFGAIDIYRAVIEKGVRDLESFKQSVKLSNR